MIGGVLKAAGRVVYDTVPLYHYRVRGNSLSRVKDMAEHNVDADTVFCEMACGEDASLADLADSFLLYDHLTCIQNYLLYFRGRETDSPHMQERYREHLKYVKDIGRRLRGNKEIGRSLRIKRYMALYAPQLLAAVTRRHVEQLAQTNKFQ